MQEARTKFTSWMMFALLPVLSACNSFFYYPDRNLYFPYQKTGYPAEEITFSSEDGTKLFAWYFPSQKQPAKGTLIQFHGNAENLTSHYLSLVWLTKEGYNLFTFDYRGYGKSEGEPDPKGVYEDGKAALLRAHELHGESKTPFILYGQSLGGAIGMRALADSPVAKETSFIVLDSTFHSYASIARKKLAGHWLTWITSPIGWLLVSDKYASTDAIRANQTPLLVIHDEEDPAVPFSCGSEIYEMTSGKKEMWVLKQGNHIAAFSDGTPHNRKKFLERLSNLSPIDSK